MNSRTAFTLIEMIVTIVIILMLMALVIPAVNLVRESARRVTCMNNLRQVSVGILSFESVQGKLPSSRFSEIQRDEGLLFRILPFVEQASLSSAFHESKALHFGGNIHLLKSVPSVYRCPNTVNPTLTLLSDRFGTAAVAGVESVACDYSFNSGYHPGAGAEKDWRKSIGPLAFSSDSKRETTLSEIGDGLSNTIGGWESVGEFVKQINDPRKLPAELAAPPRLVLLNHGGPPLVSLTKASTISYLYAWSGFRLGTLMFYDRDRHLVAPAGRIADWGNVANEYGQPYSLHGPLIGIFFCDGSTRFIPTTTDAAVIAALSSMAGREADLNYE